MYRRIRDTDSIADPAYWKSLNPTLSVGSRAKSSLWRPKKFEKELQSIESKLIREGYFQLPQFLTSHRQQVMLSAVSRLRDAGWPPAFAFVYDIFWQAPGYLEPLLSSLLGQSVRMLPDFWVWYLDPKKSESGWRPHRDRNADCIRDNGLPESITVWIALSDATTENGCIYVLPADKDPRYRKDFTDLRLDNPADVRALECPAGTLLAWNQVILHWGGSSRPSASNARVSFAYEFQRADVPAHNTPLLDPHAPPNFPQRLALIAKQVLQYQHMYLLSDQLVDLAEQLTTTITLPDSL